MHFHQQSDHCGITTGTSDHAGISAQFALLLYCLIKGKPATLALRMPAMDRTCTYNIKVENEEIFCHFQKSYFLHHFWKFRSLRKSYIHPYTP